METKQDIYARMLRDVARSWGYQSTEADVQAFDPVVGQVLSACATEFDKLRQEQEASRQRVLDSLLTTLTPDAMTTARPAHAVLHARSVSPNTYTHSGQQLFYRKNVGQTTKDIFFSPVGKYKVSNAQVRYLAVPGRLVQVDELPNRKVVSQIDPYRRGPVMPSLWIGVKVPPSLQVLDEWTFFFNWRNTPQAASLLQQLPFCRWWVNGKPLKVVKGLREQDAKEALPFGEHQTLSQHLKRQVQAHYEAHFASVLGDQAGQPLMLETLLHHYPKVFEDWFPLEDLMACTDRLLWLQVDFPEYFPLETLGAVECLLNCLPVVNRQLHRETYRMPDMLNIVPLPCEDFFFDLHRVQNEQGKGFKGSPLATLKGLEAGTYTLRHRGVGKLDERSASRHLDHLLDLLRDESAAFAAYNLNYLESQIRKLNQEISNLEGKVGKLNREDVPFLVVKPNRNERNSQLAVEYWSTCGAFANGLPAWSPLEMFANQGFERNELFLATGSMGGHDTKNSSEAFFEFKKVLTTRDRIISKEDIRTFCLAQFGDQVLAVDIQKGFLLSNLPGEGVQRTLEVRLDLKKPESGAETAIRAEKLKTLETELNEKSSGLLPIKVKEICSL